MSRPAIETCHTDLVYPRSTDAEKLRTQDQLDKLKKGKELALEALWEATKRRKQSKARRRRTKRPHFHEDTQEPSFSLHATQPGAEEKVGLPHTEYGPPERGLSYDSYDYEDDDLSISGPVTEKAAELVYEKVLAQIDLEEYERKKDEGDRKRRDAQLIAKFKADLVQGLQESHESIEVMKRKLREAFGPIVTDEQIEQFVASSRGEAIQGEEVANLLEQPTEARAADTQSASHDADVGTLKQSRGRRRRLFDLFRRNGHAPRSPTPRSRSRRPSTGSGNSYDDSSTLSEKESSLSLHSAQIHSVVVSVDGDKSVISRIRLPPIWIAFLLSMQKELQGTKRWYREAKYFKRTLANYAQLDPSTRRMAERPCGDESFRPEDLELMYARRLDEKRSTARRLLDSTLLASEPWTFYRGRILLVYRICERHGDRWSRSRSSPGGDRSPDPNGSPYFTPRPHGPTAGPDPRLYGNGGSGDPWKKDALSYPRTRQRSGGASVYNDVGYGTALQSSSRPPTYSKVNRDYLLLETLAYYDLP